MKNFGYIEPEVKKEDFVLGGNQVPKENLQPDGQWLSYLPSEEEQIRKGVDVNNCTGFGTNSALETYSKRKFFQTVNYSDRYLGIVAGTYPPGNDPNKVVETLRTVAGCIPEEIMPFVDGMAVDDYYAPKPPTTEARQLGREWLKKYYLRHDWAVTPQTEEGIRPQLLMEALKHSPVPIAVSAWQLIGDNYFRFGQDNHWCVLVGYKENEYWIIWDSYIPYVKHLSWDFKFNWAKRIYVGAQDEPSQKQGGLVYYSELIQLAFIKLLESFDNWFNSQKKTESLDPAKDEPKQVIPLAPDTIPEKLGPTVKDWSKSIQQMEGYFVGSRSYKNNNPGNLKNSNF